MPKFIRLSRKNKLFLLWDYHGGGVLKNSYHREIMSNQRPTGHSNFHKKSQNVFPTSVSVIEEQLEKIAQEIKISAQGALLTTYAANT